MNTRLSILVVFAASSALFPAACQTTPRDLTLNVGKSVVLDSAVNIRRVSVGNPEVLDAVGVGPREVLVNGKSAGVTSLILWQDGGNRLLFDVTVRQPDTKLEFVRRELSREMKGQDVSLSMEKDIVFLRGTVKDLSSSTRAMSIAGALGKTVNLLNVAVPAGDQQILLKVRFANVDRAVGSELGVNLFSTGATNTIGSLTTQQFSPPRLDFQGANKGGGTTVTLSDALNLFLFRPDLNLGATIRALQSRNLLEMLAEPNLLALNGKKASFLAGGEFPYPTVQGGGVGGVVAITIQFREFGIKVNFTPIVTPRGTIRLLVAPEVSSLDFANGLVYQGFNIPALSTRRVQTEIELESGQTFAIAGLLDNRVSETLSKLPGLGNIPVLGKFFQSRALNKNNTELLVMVTPEIVRPIPAGQPLPSLEFPKEFLGGPKTNPPGTPAVAATGTVRVQPTRETMPVEQLMEEQQRELAPAAPAPVPVQLLPIPIAPVNPAPTADAGAKPGNTASAQR